MDALKRMKEEIARKRKQVEELSDGKKFFKRGDLEAKREQDYLEKQRLKEELKMAKEDRPSSSRENSPSEARKSGNSHSMSADKKHEEVRISLQEAQKRLRARSAPILLFGENEDDVRERLVKLEIERPDLREGWQNELETAYKDVDDEMIKEVIEGSQDKAGKHDVDLPENVDNWKEIEHQATLFGLSDNPARDCDIILSIIKYLLARWGKQLNARDDEVKKSAQGRFQASIHKQTVNHMKPLLISLENHNINSDIRHHLSKICKLMVLDRNYILANDAYMEMAIGNAPWPVGVTRSGLHQRPGSAKAYVSNIAHVLNDETQRKYIQGFKRLMTRMQEYFPTDPSKCIDFVRKDES